MAPVHEASGLWSGDVVLAQARELVADAARQPVAADQFRIAHLAALRATAAVLSAHADTGSKLSRRPTSAWVLLPKLVPALEQWAEYFAAGAAQRAAADAGVSTAVTHQDADELLAAVQTYLDLCTALVLAVGHGESADAAVDSVPAPPERRFPANVSEAATSMQVPMLGRRSRRARSMSRTGAHSTPRGSSRARPVVMSRAS